VKFSTLQPPWSRGQFNFVEISTLKEVFDGKTSAHKYFQKN